MEAPHSKPPEKTNASLEDVPPVDLSADRPMTTEPEPEFVVVRPFAWQSWVELVVVLAIVGWVLSSMVRSGVISLEIIAHYLFSPAMLRAAWGTLYLATLGTIIAIALGIVVALMRVSKDPVLSRLAAAYVYIFRGTPMLIQLIFWFNAVPVMIPYIRLGLPFTGIVFFEGRSIDIITPFVAALLGLSLAETGYMAEVVRSGMLGVDRGQRDAARALGLPERIIQFRIVIPQALRIVLPSMGNEYINMLKNTSLASIIGFYEILRRTTDIYTSNFRVMELLVVAALWYLLLTSLVSILQHTLERRFPAR